jgi:hypothetical protein
VNRACVPVDPANVLVRRAVRHWDRIEREIETFGTGRSD